MLLRVSEIFYSLQGEGGRAGRPTFFVRLQGCSAFGACYASGVMCDTEFLSGGERSLEEINQWFMDTNVDCKEITWTGGEPADQLTPHVIEFFKKRGFYQAIETSGLKPIPEGIDYVTISPKVAEHVVLKQFPLRADGFHCEELRFVRHSGQEIPQTKIKAKKYFLSPHFDGINPNQDNVKHCIKLCLENPQWQLSLQLHKLLGVL